MTTDFSGLVGKVFLATQVSRGSVASGGPGGYAFTEANLMADQSAIIGTYGADATFTITSVAQTGNFLTATLAIASSNYFVTAAGPGANGTFLANGATDFILNAQSIPGLGAAFLYFTNTVGQQPGVGNRVVVPDSLANVAYTPPCFAAGTRIATLRGMVAVENLRVGDRAVVEARHGVAAGRTREIVWIGHRALDCTRHPRPHDVMPVHILPGAFGRGLPRSELRLSPDHAVLVDGVLIPVRYLVNGTTISQVAVSEVCYWHVELDMHDILLAEGLPCESYLDTGNRGAFANGGALAQLHPDFARRIWQTSACARLVTAGVELECARSWLLDCAEALGYATTSEPDLHILADGKVLKSERVGTTHRFHLPTSATDIRLVSRSAIPADVRLSSTDHRRLGVAVSRLTYGGRMLPLSDPALGSGWHPAEIDADDIGWRWTGGNAGLSLSGGSLLVVELAMTEIYPIATEGHEPASPHSKGPERSRPQRDDFGAAVAKPVNRPL